ncbi:MAG: glutaredoxin domain-containing protein, partial [Amphiplicatus sp.]
MTEAAPRTAVLYRMATPDHLCPFGLKSKALLERKGYRVDDRLLKTRAETDAYMAREGVKTTPQTFIEDRRIGGYDDLKRFFGASEKDEDAPAYAPVIAIFGVSLLMALAASWAVYGSLLTVRAGEWFIAFSMCALAMQKLRDLTSFTNAFLGYDLLARRWVRYAYVYPFAEAFAGVLMIAGALIWLAAPAALFIGAVGAVSVFKAVYI